MWAMVWGDGWESKLRGFERTGFHLPAKSRGARGSTRRPRLPEMQESNLSPFSMIGSAGIPASFSRIMSSPFGVLVVSLAVWTVDPSRAGLHASLHCGGGLNTPGASPRLR